MREQTELGREHKVVPGEELEQQIEDEQWDFIRGEVEKMKQARELVQKEQLRLKEEEEKVKSKELNLKLKKSKGFKKGEKRLKTQYYELRGDLINCRTR